MAPTSNIWPNIFKPSKGEFVQFSLEGTKYIREKMTCSSHFPLEFSRKEEQNKEGEKNPKAFGHRGISKKSLQKFLQKSFSTKSRVLNKVEGSLEQEKHKFMQVGISSKLKN